MVYVWVYYGLCVSVIRFMCRCVVVNYSYGMVYTQVCYYFFTGVL